MFCVSIFQYVIVYLYYVIVKTYKFLFILYVQLYKKYMNSYVCKTATTTHLFVEAANNLHKRGNCRFLFVEIIVFSKSSTIGKNDLKAFQPLWWLPSSSACLNMVECVQAVSVWCAHMRN